MAKSKTQLLKESKAKRKELLKAERDLETQLNASKEERKEARKDVTRTRIVVQEALKELKLTIRKINTIVVAGKTSTMATEFKAANARLLENTDFYLTVSDEHTNAMDKLTEHGG